MVLHILCLLLYGFFFLAFHKALQKPLFINISLKYILILDQQSEKFP